jgi:hypothetical protein
MCASISAIRRLDATCGVVHGLRAYREASASPALAPLLTSLTSDPERCRFCGGKRLRMAATEWRTARALRQIMSCAFDDSEG